MLVCGQNKYGQLGFGHNNHQSMWRTASIPAGARADGGDHAAGRGGGGVLTPRSVLAFALSATEKTFRYSTSQ